MLKPLPDRDELERLFRYEWRTGVLYWRRRPEMSESWNTKYAGRAVGSPNSCGYLETRIDYEKFLVHRIIWKLMLGDDPGDLVDHKDTNKTHNRIENFRLADRSKNGANCRAHRDNRSGYKGVYRSGKKYCAEITVRRERIYLGSSDTREGAAALYSATAQEHFGAFARTQKAGD